MQEPTKANLQKIETWKRIIYMLMFAFLDGMVKIILWLIIFAQTATVLLTGRSNPNLLDLGKNLSGYHYQILLFLTFNSEDLPFPFAPWQNNV